MNSGGFFGRIAQVIRDMPNKYGWNKPPTVEPPVSPVLPTYSAPTIQMPLVQQYAPLPEMKSLASIQSMPEYNQALKWQLPEKPTIRRTGTIDPQMYEKQWDLSQQAINQAFNAPGGIYEQKINPLIERGLGQSGEMYETQGAGLRGVGEDYARQLVQARSGIDIARMQEEAQQNMAYDQMQQELNQWYGGLQAEQAAAQPQLAQLLMGMRAQQDLYNAGLPLQQFGAQIQQLSAADRLAAAQNEMVARQYEQQVAADRAAYESEWARKQYEQDQWQQQWRDLQEMLGLYPIGDTLGSTVGQQWRERYGFRSPNTTGMPYNYGFRTGR